MTPWPRAIILVDMNAFFAAVEQRNNPAWRGQPLAITNGLQGTCIITSSYEARAYGVKTGMRLKEARKLCPKLIQCPAHPDKYAKISGLIMEALQALTPDVEVFSVDEAFLDVTHCQKLWGTPPSIAAQVKQTVFEISGLLCSVGVSGDKTTAKYAAKLNKPDGLTVIPPWEAAARLRSVPVTELCGIAQGIGRFLALRGVRTCGDMQKLPVSVLQQRFGPLGQRIWLMCQGLDPSPVITHVPPPKSMGHGKVMPPNTRDTNIISTYLMHMAYKLATRLRRHEMQAQTFSISLRGHYYWLGGKYRSANPTNDQQLIFKLCMKMLQETWQGEGVSQVQVTALDPLSVKGQLSLFDEPNQQRESLNAIMDQINDRFGEFALAPAPLLQRSTMPNVIAPAWKPFGHRQTV